MQETLQSAGSLARGDQAVTSGDFIFTLLLILFPATACLVIYSAIGAGSRTCDKPLALWLLDSGLFGLGFGTLLLLKSACAWLRERRMEQDGLPETMRVEARKLSPIYCCDCIIGCPLAVYLMVWFVLGVTWVFGTSIMTCDPVLYDAAKTYTIAYLASILPFGCCICCCFGKVTINGEQVPNGAERLGSLGRV